MRARPSHIHVSSLSRRELSHRRRRRRLAVLPGRQVAAVLVAAEAATVLAVWADRLF